MPKKSKSCQIIESIQVQIVKVETFEDYLGPVYHYLVEIQTDRGKERFWVLGPRMDFIRGIVGLETRYLFYRLFDQGYSAAGRNFHRYLHEVWGINDKNDAPEEAKIAYREDLRVHQKLSSLGIPYNLKIIEDLCKRKGRWLRPAKINSRIKISTG